jgi:hypothetical protein
MPKLQYSSETKACGATIQLDSEEICIVSVAQTGVLVRSYRDNFLGHLLGSFFGPVLYNEKNVYKATKAAMALAERFPVEIVQLQFNSPLLSAFAKVVWQSASAGRVAIVLNEAIVRENAREPVEPWAAPTHSTPSDTAIIRDLGALVERAPLVLTASKTRPSFPIQRM